MYSTTKKALSMDHEKNSLGFNFPNYRVIGIAEIIGITVFAV